MPDGLATLSTSFTMGSLAATVTPLILSEFAALKESNPISSSTGGNYRSLTYADLVFVQSDGIHWRAYDPGSNSFDGSVVFGDTTLTYIDTTDLSGDGFDDIYALSDAVAKSGDTNANYVVSYLADPSAASGAAPFGGSIVSHIPSGGMNLDSDEAGFIQIHDSANADFNGDGIMDVIVIGVNGMTRSLPANGQSPPSTTEYLLGCYAIGLGNGQGGFEFQPFEWDGTNFSGTNAFIGLETGVSARVTAGDFNGDGYVDAAFAYHPVAGMPVVLGGAPAFVIWGDSISSSDAPVLNTDSSNTYSNGWQGANDLMAVRNSASATADQLVITFDSTAHIASFNADKSLDQDNKLRDIPRGNLGTALDYNLDGSPDFIVNDGNSSIVAYGYDWSGTSGDYDSYIDLTLGTDIHNATGIDFNGDGKPDVYGSYNDYLYVYENGTIALANQAMVTLAENVRVDDRAINGVGRGPMEGSAFSLSIVGGRTDYDNALGWFELRADGSFGEARFLPIGTSQPITLGGLEDGSRLALFLVADGADLNASLDGAFRFVDATTGEAARLGSRTPLLQRVGGDEGFVAGDIFHTADADSLDLVNALNTGGQVQALSRFDAGDGSLMIGFEDLRLAQGDADFNDLVLRVSTGETLLG
jgi:hypothetical protein